MPDIGDDVDDDVNLLKNDSKNKLKDDFSKMNIVDDDDDATSIETISCSSNSSFLKSNLNSKMDRDKMIKNTFLKIFGRYYFQKWNYNTFPVKRMDEGGKIEEKEILKNFEASKQRGEDHFKRKIQGVLDDVMDTILLVEEDRNEKEITQEIIDSGIDVSGNYHSLFSTNFNNPGLGRTLGNSLCNIERLKSAKRSSIINNKRLPLSDREKAVIEFNNKFKYISISHISTRTKKHHEVYIGHSSSKKLFEVYKKWCNRDPMVWEKYLATIHYEIDGRNCSSIKRSTDEYINDRKSASMYSYVNRILKEKPSILSSWDGNPYKPTFLWEDKQINGIPYNSLNLLDKPVTLKDVLDPIRFRGFGLNQSNEEVTLIDYFGTRDNDIDSKTTSETTLESSDLEIDISIRSSSELTLDYGNESEIDMTSSSSGTTLVSDSSVSTLDFTNDSSSGSEHRIINNHSLASTISAASNSTFDYGNESESGSTFGSRSSLHSYHEPTTVHSIMPNNSVDQLSVRRNSDSGTDVELPGSDSTINNESISNLQDRLPTPPSEVYLQRINLKRSYSPITLMNRSNIKAYFNIDKYSRYPSEYFGDVDKVSGIRIKKFNLKEGEKNLFCKKRKDRPDVTYNYHITQYYNEFHGYEFNSYDNSKNHNTWKKIRHNHFVKSIEDEDLTSDEEDEDYTNFDEKLIRSNLNQIRAHRQKVQKDWERWCDNEGIIWF